MRKRTQPYIGNPLNKWHLDIGWNNQEIKRRNIASFTQGCKSRREFLNNISNRQNNDLLGMAVLMRTLPMFSDAQGQLDANQQLGVWKTGRQVFRTGGYGQALYNKSYGRPAWPGIDPSYMNRSWPR